MALRRSSIKRRTRCRNTHDEWLRNTPTVSCTKAESSWAVSFKPFRGQHREGEEEKKKTRENNVGVPTEATGELSKWRCKARSYSSSVTPALSPLFLEYTSGINNKAQLNKTWRVRRHACHFSRREKKKRRICSNGSRFSPTFLTGDVVTQPFIVTVPGSIWPKELLTRLRRSSWICSIEGVWREPWSTRALLL